MLSSYVQLCLIYPAMMKSSLNNRIYDVSFETRLGLQSNTGQGLIVGLILYSVIYENMI